MKRTNSESAWQEAQSVLAGGVNSPVRAFNSVGGTPVFIAGAQGSRITDIDGNSYIDYVGSWGPALLGHADPRVIAAVREQAESGLGFGAPTLLETEMAAVVRSLVPSMRKIRFVSSGTEACMSAIRLARGHTGRKLIVSFAGCYHGHADSFLGNAGSGLLSLGICEAAGVVPELSRFSLCLDYNDSDALKQVFARHGDDIAAVIVEPVAANMNLVIPAPGFLQSIVDLCQRHGAVSIFDEVMTGFRVHTGGAQALFGISPDMTILGKIVGGGLPVGAYGGKESIMDDLAPVGKVYQAGTLSGNPLAMRAGLETLRILSEEGFAEAVAERTQRLVDAMNETARSAGLDVSAHCLGSLFGIHFLPRLAGKLSQIRGEAHQNGYRRLFHHMLDRGVYLAPSPFEAGFVSAAHSDADITSTIDSFAQSCALIQKESA